MTTIPVDAMECKSVLKYLLLISVLLLAFTTNCHAASTGKRDPGISSASDGSEGVAGVLVVAVSLAVVICGVVVVMGCADICQRGSGFKDFDNEETYSTEVVTPPTQSEFTMYPPIENTPDSLLASNPIIFEPLPDLTAKMRQPSHVTNNAHLRPKIAQAKERAESEESLDEAIHRDTIQDKMKLQNLIMNARHQLPRSQLQYIKELGAGWFGKVLQGEGQRILPGHKKTKVVIQMLKEDADPHEQLTFLQEGTPYRDVDHPNVMRLLGQCVETSPYLTVLELCPFGDLKTYLRSHRVAQESFNEKGLLLKFACDMAAGLQALHQHNFVHGDFAIRNCMLASDLSVKVGDYGIAEDMFKEDYYFDGSQDGIPIRWLAPEMLVVSDDQLYVRRMNRASNIWSYGVALWEVISFGSLPYSDLSNENVLRLVVKEGSVRLPRPDVNISHIDRIYQLMQLCWSETFSRPSLRELRIMLLHLLSQKDETLTAAFDQKWNQLLPRRSPQVVNVRNLEKANGIANPAMNLEQKLQQQQQHTAQSGITELNASMLGHSGSLGDSNDSLNKEIAQVHRSDPLEPTTPINDLSLEAELSRVNMSDGNQGNQEPANQVSLEQELSAVHSNDPSLQEELSSAVEEENQKEAGGHSDEELNKTAENLQRSPIGQSTPVKITLTEAGTENSKPDIVSPDTDTKVFATSTPKQDNVTSEGEGESFLTTNDSSSQQSGAMFHTALTSQTSRDSTNSFGSVNYEDRSIFGSQKFAEMLQTVTMSFDEDMDPNSLSAASSLEKSTEEEVFQGFKGGENQSAALDGSTSTAAIPEADVTITEHDERNPTPTPSDHEDNAGNQGDEAVTSDESLSPNSTSVEGIYPLSNDTDSKMVKEEKLEPLSNGITNDAFSNESGDA